jgi:hypothetical protein
VLLTVANIVLQEYLFAGVAIVSGVIWLVLQIKEQEPPHSFFFVLFLGLTILGSLRNISIPFMLLALSSDLAAWDLSRFLARISQEEEGASKTFMELRHVQKLAFTLSIGFLVALFPTFIHISLNFVVFLFILFLLILTLRKSVLYLREEPDTKN